MDPEIPAGGTAPENAETVETPATAAAPEAVAEPASAPVEPSKEAPVKPDLASLLSDPEYRKQLFEHPDLRQEIEHRASSEAGRRAKAEIERIQQQENARLERERLKTMDEYELGVQTKQKLAEEDAAKELETRVRTRLQEEQEKLTGEFYRQRAEEIRAAAAELGQEIGLSVEEMAELNPGKYDSMAAFIKGVAKYLGTRQGQKLAKELAKVEAKAMVEEQNAQARETAASVEVLAPGEPGQTDAEFEADYAAGKTNNHARQIKMMREHGIML